MSTLRITFAILSLVCTNAFAQTSFWADSAAPDLREVTSTESVTLGLRFHSDVPGYITGIQFYKGSNNTGTHTGALWSNSGREACDRDVLKRNIIGLAAGEFFIAGQHRGKHNLCGFVYRAERRPCA